MLRLTKLITRKLSIRLSLMIVFAIATLLTAALLIILQYARKTVRQEALEKAGQMLETTVTRIDNILFGIEQAAGNMLWEVQHNLDHPERMTTYCREIMKTNPNILGCAIAFEPYYYKEKGQYFMTYVYRTDGDELATSNSPIIQTETFGNRPYNEQIWYTKPIQTGNPLWIDPLRGENAEGEDITTFCLPLTDLHGKTVGVMGIDLSIALLSQIVLATKPSPDSYCTMLGKDGTYIVHPDSNKLFHQTVFTQTEHNYSDPTIKKAAEAIMAGGTGYKFFRINGVDSYVFYKPFKRAIMPNRFTDDLGWSVGVIYPEDNIFGDYQRLLYSVWGIAIVGLLLLLALTLYFTHSQLIPLRLLTSSAQRIAHGHYNDPIPDSIHHDEIGQLQNNFQRMQQSLATHMSELDRLTATLKERGEFLNEAYNKAKEADRMKTAFLHNMTNQMVEPVESISASVKTLCDQYYNMDLQEASRLVENIEEQGKTVTSLLDDMLDVSQNSISSTDNEHSIPSD